MFMLLHKRTLFVARRPKCVARRPIFNFKGPNFWLPNSPGGYTAHMMKSDSVVASSPVAHLV